MLDSPNPIIRYSPRPLEEYIDKSGVLGPAVDSRVDRPEIWNLAYLSFDYDRNTHAKDPHFLTHVRRTAQMNLRTGEPDLAWKGPEEYLLLPLLRQPAPWFVKWLNSNRRLLVKLPLYQAYGSKWMVTVERRARLCRAHDAVDDPAIQDTGQASSVLQQFMLK
jgi:hypothetical protein